MVEIIKCVLCWEKLLNFYQNTYFDRRQRYFLWYNISFGPDIFRINRMKVIPNKSCSLKFEKI